MKIPWYKLKRMHKEFLAYERASETKEKIDQLDQDMEFKRRIEQKSKEDLLK